MILVVHADRAVDDICRHEIECLSSENLCCYNLILFRRYPF